MSLQTESNKEIRTVWYAIMFCVFCTFLIELLSEFFYVEFSINFLFPYILNGYAKGAKNTVKLNRNFLRALPELLWGRLDNHKIVPMTKFCFRKYFGFVPKREYFRKKLKTSLNCV